MRQRYPHWGTFLDEATRVLILIVAEQPDTAAASARGPNGCSPRSTTAGFPSCDNFGVPARHEIQKPDPVAEPLVLAW